jgi:hypothetical protein
MKQLVLILANLISFNILANYDADWSDKAYIPEGENRANIFNLTESELNQFKNNGIIHAEKYPVEVTGLLIPYKPLITFLESNPKNPLKKLLYELGKDFTGFKSEHELYSWLGISENNSENETGIYKIPFPNGKKDNLYAGAGLINKNGTNGLTFSCFACHSNYLFGKLVVGLTNKRPRANTFFHLARGTVPHLPTPLFALSTNSTKEEAEMFDRTKKNLVSVEALNPKVIGLDTSLSQIALSLARRNSDEYATKSPYFEKHPRPNILSTKVADSKPMPWWNVKYKTRWLSDGSIVEGNPIYTNILWNEIGRGTDLVVLEKWMQNNEQKINELTAAVFSTEAPKWTDFFDVKSINIENAKRGEIVFNKSCVNCHGSYEKAWSNPNAENLSDIEKVQTTKVSYHDRTPVEDVGTDSGRYEATKYFSDDLNKLAISKTMKTKVVPQIGYVPPPLVGVWSRYPYLHNNSIPNLCALVNPPKKRPTSFYQGPSVDAKTDFDFECVGYPTGEKIPKVWLKDTESLFKTTTPGLSNTGHYQMFLDKNGNELYSEADKKDLIEYLKTL